MIKFAFYNGRSQGAKFVHKVILAVSDPYTHCELVFSDHLSYSSQLMIGPRFKKITYGHPDRWHIVHAGYITPEQEARIRYRAELKVALQKAGLIGYDSKGAIGCSIIPLTGSAWNDFCSETIYDIVAPEIALPSLNTGMHPQRLLEIIAIIEDLNR